MAHAVIDLWILVPLPTKSLGFQVQLAALVTLGHLSFLWRDAIRTPPSHLRKLPLGNIGCSLEMSALDLNTDHFAQVRVPFCHGAVVP